MSSWEAISNYMSERQENRDMGQNDHIRMGEQGFVYTDRQPYELTEDQPDEYGLPGVITAGGGLDEELDIRPSLTQGPKDTLRDTARYGTLEWLQEEHGWDTQTARDFAETLWGTSGDLSKTAFGIGIADFIPVISAPLVMQEGFAQSKEGIDKGSGTDIAVGGLITAAGVLEAIPVMGAGFKMLNKAAQSEVVKEFITVAGDAFNRTGEITQDALIEAGEAAQARLDSMMSGTTLSANPIGAVEDMAVAGAGKIASKFSEIKENFSAVENVYNLYFNNQNIPPKTAEKIKAVIQKHTATNDLNTAEQAMLGPALDEVKALQNAAKNKARKPRWPSKIDLTTIDGVASALKQKLGGGAISGKPWNSRYFDVGENSRLRISDHLAATRRSTNNSGEVIVSYGNKGINFDVGENSLTIPYNDKRLSNRDGLQELIDLVESSDAIELGADKGPIAALPQTVINDNEVPSLRDVLVKKSEEMQFKPAERTQPTDDQMFDVAPESYEQGIVSEMQIETPVPRAPAGAKLPKKGRTQGIVDNIEEIADRIAERARPGIGTNVQYFYHLGPLVNKAQELGIPEEETRQAIKEFSMLYGVTSPRTRTEPNLRSATLVRAKDKQNINYDEIVGPGGSGINEAGFPMMINEAKKGQSAGIHKLLIDQLRATGKIDYKTNPKPATFAENVGGNLNGVTVDTHAIRGALYMLNEIAPGSIPRQWFNSETAYKAYLDDPSNIENYAGKGIADTLDGQVVDGSKQQTEYAVFSDLYRMVSDRLDVRPAEAQSLSWFANGEFTGLASPPKTIVELINERVDVTAQALGRSKDAIFKAFIEGKIPLMSFSGALVGASMLEQKDGN